MVRRLIRGNRFRRNFYANVNSATFVIEVDLSFNQREERVIAAHTDVLPRMPLGPALANDDVARDDRFAAELLDAQTLRIGIATVAAGTLPLLMSHFTLPFIWNLPSRRSVLARGRFWKVRKCSGVPAVNQQTRRACLRQVCEASATRQQVVFLEQPFAGASCSLDFGYSALGASSAGFAFSAAAGFAASGFFGVTFSFGGNATGIWTSSGW